MVRHILTGWAAVLLTPTTVLLAEEQGVEAAAEAAGGPDIFAGDLGMAVFTLAIFVVGHLLWSLPMLEEHLVSPVGRGLCRSLYYVLPNLGNFDIKGEVVHGLAIDPSQIGFAMLYLVLYGSAVLAGACAIFHGRELQ